ncbi:HPF/RaiA family ribosome-associated protein [Azohydromonas aeria]|uniref:HPF/RaiA family ribosome-associated protein n=1 Tax=Azohydromonas aeria TaxID=2590212 RepID=UPI0012F945E0|nr:HPF/RaiA family ribosome-associated protein [Azohydromonas aeria]
MDIRVRALHACVNNALIDHVRRRLLFVLMRRHNQVQRVDVRLGDTRSRRGLAKGYCLIELQLMGALTVTVVGAGVDLYDVIDLAADRVGHLAVEQLRQPQLSERTWHAHDLHR